MAILKGIKPAVAGLIAAAALFIGQTALRYDPLLANQAVYRFGAVLSLPRQRLLPWGS